MTTVNTVKLPELTKEANSLISTAIDYLSGLDKINKKHISDTLSKVHLKPELRGKIFEKCFKLEMNLCGLAIDNLTMPFLDLRATDSNNRGSKVAFDLFKRLDAKKLPGMTFQITHIYLTALYRTIYFDNQPDDYYEYKKQKYKELTCIDIDELEPLIRNVDYDFRNHPKILAYLTQCKIDEISRGFPTTELAIATYKAFKKKDTENKDLTSFFDWKES